MKKTFKLSFVLLPLLVSSSSAVSLKDALEQTINNDSEIKTLIANDKANELFIKEAKGGYYPTLDLSAFIGKKRTKTNPDDGDNTTSDVEGGSAQLDLEQKIYDGGKTSSRISESKHKYLSSKYKNKKNLSNVLYNTTNSYMNAVRYKTRLAITEKSLDVYDEYYKRALKSEEIGGGELEKVQVSSKIHYEKNRYLDEQNKFLESKSYFENKIDLKLENICRPNINTAYIPKDLKVYLDTVLLKNNDISQQIEKIKEQRAVLNRKNSGFYPSLAFKAQALYDNDFITEKEQTQIYTAKLELKYNLYNGNKDRTVSKREKLFLKESQKKLDSVTNNVLNEATVAHNTYAFSKKRIIELNKYIKDNEKILEIYQEQFDGGTRTFIDVLNVERDLFNAQRDLVGIIYESDMAYYKMINLLGKMDILLKQEQSCNDTKFIYKKGLSDFEDSELNFLLDENIEEKKRKRKKEIIIKPIKEDIGAKKEVYIPKETITNAVSSIKYNLYVIAAIDALNAQKELAKIDELLGGWEKVEVIELNGYFNLSVKNISEEKVNSIKEKLIEQYPDMFYILAD